MSMRTACLAGAVALVLTAAAACSSSSGTSSPGASASSSATSIASTPGPKAGGSITVLEGKGFSGDWPLGLDPATNTTGSADQDYDNAVYGELFELGTGGKQIDDLATGYKFSNNNQTVTINLRPNVKFSDGTRAHRLGRRVELDAGPGVELHLRAAVDGRADQPEGHHLGAREGRHQGARAADHPGEPGRARRRVHQPMFDAIPNWIISEVSFKRWARGVRPAAGRGRTVHHGERLVQQRDRGEEEPDYWDAPLPYLDGSRSSRSAVTRRPTRRCSRVRARFTSTCRHRR